jgi:hypothetical protein
MDEQMLNQAAGEAQALVKGFLNTPSGWIMVFGAAMALSVVTPWAMLELEPEKKRVLLIRALIGLGIVVVGLIVKLLGG